MNEANVLCYNPFEGDFGSPGDRTLKDKMVTAKKSRACHQCLEQIQPGERIRVRADIFEEQLVHYSWCQLCCEAMDKSWTDDWAMDERMKIRNKNKSCNPN